MPTIFESAGTLRHRRGVTDVPGLYFQGMTNQYSRGSAFTHSVHHHAAYIVDQITHTRSTTSAAATRLTSS